MSENKRKKRAVRWCGIAILFMIVSMLGASFIQTSGGRVKVKKLQFETTMGYEMSGLLLKPETATAGQKAPAVIACHGMYNNKEMMDIDYVELSRRGFVVLAIDMFSHGNSENLVTEDALPMGVAEALKMISTLDYVDTGRIGVTGHSMGGMNCDVATLMDNQNETPLVSALLLNSCFATYSDAETKEYINAYGNRDVGIIAGKYDEFLFKEVNRDGAETLAKDFIKSDNAQSFLNFGNSPDEGEMRKANTVYEESVGGKDAMRVIYNPGITHPWSLFSRKSAEASIEFFDSALESPNPIAASNQVWQMKQLFNLLGLIGLGIFALNFTIVLVHKPMFAGLCLEEEAAPRVLPKKRKMWLWGTAIAGMIISTVLYLPIVILARSSDNGKVLFAQNSTFGIALWAAACGGLIILGLLITSRTEKENSKLFLAETGLKISLKQLGKTIILALTAVGTTYLWVFAADYFFKTDFRIWVLAAKAFTVDKVAVILFPNAVLFMIFYIASSVSVNCFHYYESDDKKHKRMNTFVQALFAVLPSLILVVLQYVHLRATGSVLFAENNAHSYILWLFPMIVMIPASVVISRKIYRETRNPYLPGIINALLITIISCVNTVTWG